MILLTTSHRPTRRVRSLCNDLANSIPRLIRVNRGKMSLLDVAERSLELGSDRFVIIDRWKGGPGRIRFFLVADEGPREAPPRLYISGVKLRREHSASREGVREKINLLFIDVSEAADPEVERLRLSISEFFGLPMLEEATETIGYEAYMCINSGEDCWAYISFFLLPGNIEVGPRIKLSHAVWNL